MVNKILESIKGFGDFVVTSPDGKVKGKGEFTNTVQKWVGKEILKLLVGDESGDDEYQRLQVRYIRVVVGKSGSHANLEFRTNADGDTPNSSYGEDYPTTDNNGDITGANLRKIGLYNKVALGTGTNTAIGESRTIPIGLAVNLTTGIPAATFGDTKDYVYPTDPAGSVTGRSGAPEDGNITNTHDSFNNIRHIHMKDIIDTYALYDHAGVLGYKDGQGYNYVVKPGDSNTLVPARSNVRLGLVENVPTVVADAEPSYPLDSDNIVQALAPGTKTKSDNIDTLVDTNYTIGTTNKTTYSYKGLTENGLTNTNTGTEAVTSGDGDMDARFTGWRFSEIPVDGVFGNNRAGVQCSFKTNLGGAPYSFSGNGYLINSSTDYDHYWCFDTGTTAAVDAWQSSLDTGAARSNIHMNEPADRGKIDLDLWGNAKDEQMTKPYSDGDGNPPNPGFDALQYIPGATADGRNLDEEQGQVVGIELLNRDFVPIAGSVITNAPNMDRNDNFFVDYKLNFVIPTASAETLPAGLDFTNISTTMSGGVGPNLPIAASSQWRVEFIDRLARLVNPVGSVNLANAKSKPISAKLGLHRDKADQWGVGSSVYSWNKRTTNAWTSDLPFNAFSGRRMGIIGVSVHSFSSNSPLISQVTAGKLAATSHKIDTVTSQAVDDTHIYIGDSGTGNSRDVVPYNVSSDQEVTFANNNTAHWNSSYYPANRVLGNGSETRPFTDDGDFQFFLNPMTTDSGQSTTASTDSIMHQDADGGTNPHSALSVNLSSMTHCKIVGGVLQMELTTDTRFKNQPRWYRVWYGDWWDLFQGGLPSATMRDGTTTLAEVNSGDTYDEPNRFQGTGPDGFVDTQDGAGYLLPPYTPHYAPLALYLVNVENVLFEGAIQSVDDHNQSIWTKGDTLKLTWTIAAPDIS